MDLCTTFAFTKSQKPQGKYPQSTTSLALAAEHLTQQAWLLLTHAMKNLAQQATTSAAMETT